MKKLIIILKLMFVLQAVFFTAAGMAQNINNTLGTGGIFTVKDANFNFFTVTQSTGQVNILNTLKLDNTSSSSAGVLYIGSNRFMHNKGGSNMFLGEMSGNFTMTGQFNTGVGSNALFALTSGNNNSALGFGSLGGNTSGIDNTACGFGALRFNTSGNYNSAFGSLSLRNNTTGSYNSAMGHLAMLNNLTGIENCAFGNMALTTNTGGSWNSAFGSESLLQSTMNFNTAIGRYSGSTITTGSGIVCIGYNSQPSSGNAVNQLTLGNSSVTSLRCAVTTITSLSDARDKKNINNLNLGIGFLMKIKPRLFNWDKREWYENNVSDGTKIQESPTAGFIAQELDEAETSENAEWLRLVLKDNPEKFEAMAGNLLPVIVKALQELRSENEGLKNTNAELKNKNKGYGEQLLKLKALQELMALEIEKMRSKKNTEELRAVLEGDQK